MKRRQLVYNAQGLRHDGCYKLAKIIAAGRGKRKHRPYTVVLAFCGVDGSLLDVPVPTKTEDWADIAPVLEPLLREIKAERLGAGLDLLGSIPCFHSTDVLAKHRKKIRRLYKHVWPELRVQAVGTTPRAKSARRRIGSAKRTKLPMLVTGEPAHNMFAL
eukprot:71377-Karenia_brevis.AAC.1